MLIFQGELEHRMAKGCYPHTDEREFIKQMTHIERWETRIRCIHTQTFTEHSNYTSYEAAMPTPEVHAHIGTSKAFPEHVGCFVMGHSGDPAVNVY